MKMTLRTLLTLTRDLIKQNKRFKAKVKELEGNLWTYKKCFENSKKQFAELARFKEKEIKALEKENKRLKEELK